MAKDATTVTVYGRLSFPVLTYKEALARNATSPTPRKDEQVTPEFLLALEQGQFDKYLAFVKDEFLPYCIEQHKAGEKRNALSPKEVGQILNVIDGDLEIQPPYVSLKPVSDKTLALAPATVGVLKVVGQRGRDLDLQAIVRDEDELVVPDPDLLKFPALRPLHKTKHDLYPGCYASATLNLYAFLSGKTPGFSSSASVLVFRQDADRFGGGVAVDMEELFSDD